MSPDPTVVHPFDVRTVEAGVSAVEHERAARPQDTRRLREHRGEVVDIGRDPDGRHSAEAPVAKRQCRRVTVDDVRGMVPGVPQLISRSVETNHGPAGGGQRVQVAAATAAHVEARSLARPE